MPKQLRVLSLLAAVLSAGATLEAGPFIFGSDVSGENLVQINALTLTGTTIGSSVTDVAGLAFDSNNGVLYGVVLSNLYTINTLTGAGTLVTTIATGGNAAGLAFDADNGLLYISDVNSNELFSYNIATTALTSIGTIGGGFSGIEGLGYDKSTGTLFGLADTQGRIITIDTTDASAVGLPNFLTGGIWRGLDFSDATGLLYATRVNSDSHLFSVDPLTGIGTDLGLMTGAGNFNFVQGLAVEYYTPVPEPSAYAAVAGLGALGFAAWSRRRRWPT